LQKPNNLERQGGNYAVTWLFFVAVADKRVHAEQSLDNDVKESGATIKLIYF